MRRAQKSSHLVLEGRSGAAIGQQMGSKPRLNGRIVKQHDFCLIPVELTSVVCLDAFAGSGDLIWDAGIEKPEATDATPLTPAKVRVLEK